MVTGYDGDGSGCGDCRGCRIVDADDVSDGDGYSRGVTDGASGVAEVFLVMVMVMLLVIAVIGVVAAAVIRTWLQPELITHNLVKGCPGPPSAVVLILHAHAPLAPLLPPTHSLKLSSNLWVMKLSWVAAGAGSLHGWQRGGAGRRV